MEHHIWESYNFQTHLHFSLAANDVSLFLPKPKRIPRRFLGLDAPLRFFRKDAIYEAGLRQWSSTPRVAVTV